MYVDLAKSKHELAITISYTGWVRGRLEDFHRKKLQTKVWKIRKLEKKCVF